MDVSADLEALLADREMAALFVGEAGEHLNSIEALVLQLEHAPGDRSLLDAVYRPFHTIKGNAYAIGARSVGAIAHGIESLLGSIRSDEKRLDTRDLNAILATVDQLKEMIDVLAQGLQAPTAPRPSGGGHLLSEEPASIKVDTRRLDTLVDMVGELMILQAMIRENVPALSQSDQLVGRQFATFGRLLLELQRVSLSLRMVSLGRTFHRVARVVHDLSHTCGKPVDLTMSGETTELDRHVIEQVADPLLHLVRNAIDHGVEDAATRARLGKPPRAQLTLRASCQEAQVCIEIADDGCGLDASKIRARAVAIGLIDADDAVSASEINSLIFEPGFSTADAVTDLSGRGVGMDVVRRNVEALGGLVDIRTVLGEGTTFSLRVPLTMAIVQGVLVGAGGERFVLPAHVLREALREADCDVHQGPGGRPFISVRGVTMPFVELSKLLGGVSDPGHAHEGVVLAIDVDNRQAAIRADRVFGVQEFIAKPLKTLERVRGFSGATVLGDGSVGLILDAAGLFELIDGTARAVA